jgi:hypothetical protein
VVYIGYFLIISLFFINISEREYSEGFLYVNEILQIGAGTAEKVQFNIGLILLLVICRLPFEFYEKQITSSNNRKYFFGNSKSIAGIM